MRGRETIKELLPVATDWRGDPIEGAEAPDPREIEGCQLIPRTHPEKDDIIVDGWQVFVPADQTPPDPENSVLIRGIEYEIEGNIGEYDMKGTPKGALFSVQRLRPPVAS